jgi:GT2 family glycosyltransferase
VTEPTIHPVWDYIGQNDGHVPIHASGVSELSSAPQKQPGLDNGPALRCTVAIPTYLREHILTDTIQCVLNQDPPADEVLVIDQTPSHSPETAAFLDRQVRLGHIRWIRQEVPNLPAARNRALRETASDIVIFIDDDVILTPGFIANHLRNYADVAVSAVAGRIIQPKHNTRQACNSARAGRSHLFDYLSLTMDSTQRVEWIANVGGCNHSVRRRQILALGGYDEHYVGWAFREDTDLAMRLWKSHANIVFDPDACLTHLAAPAGGCRIHALPEWQVSFPANYFAFRHFYPSRHFWADILCRNVRKYVFRKTNVLNPWRLPWAAAHYVSGLALSWWTATHSSRGILPYARDFGDHDQPTCRSTAMPD